MFIIYDVYVKGKELIFSNTCNVFHNYAPDENNETEKNKALSKLAIEAYKNSNKTTIFETNYGFTEELVLYNDYLFCFICSTSYKLLFNYLPTKDLFIYNSFPNLNKYQIEKIHDVSSEDLIGNIKIILYNGFTTNYKVICSYEAFSNYCKNNTENSSENTLVNLFLTIS